MIPPVQVWLQGVPAVTSIFGAGTSIRFYRDVAPPNTVLPYGTFGVVAGTPENYLGDRPGIDAARFQIDVYATTQPAVDAAYKAVRDALETRGHIVSFNGTMKDPDTNNFRVSFDIDLWTPR